VPFKIFGREYNYTQVATFADLPAASGYAGEVFVVLTATGTWPFNRKRAGLYRSNGSSWDRLGVAPTAEDINAVTSEPPDGYYPVTNLYVSQQTGKLWVDYDDGQ